MPSKCRRDKLTVKLDQNISHGGSNLAQFLLRFCLFHPVEHLPQLRVADLDRREQQPSLLHTREQVLWRFRTSRHRGWSIGLAIRQNFNFNRIPHRQRNPVPGRCYRVRLLRPVVRTDPNTMRRFIQIHSIAKIHMGAKPTFRLKRCANDRGTIDGDGEAHSVDLITGPYPFCRTNRSPVRALETEATLVSIHPNPRIFSRTAVSPSEEALPFG